jgi:hypothetical protein
VKFSYVDFARVIEDDARYIEEATQVIRRTVHLHGPQAFQQAVDETVPAPVDRGTYRRSIRTEDIPGGAVMYNSAPHAGVVELGRRPGSRPPPLEVIEAWVHRKGLAGTRDIGTGKLKRPKKSPEYLAKVRRIAYAIRQAIAQRGLPAQLVMERASDDVDREVHRALLAFEADRGMTIGGSNLIFGGRGSSGG